MAAVSGDLGPPLRPHAHMSRVGGNGPPHRQAHGLAGALSSAARGAGRGRPIQPIRAAQRSRAHVGAVHKTGARGGILNRIGRFLQLPLPVPDWSKPIILVLLIVSLALGIRARVSSRRARRLGRNQKRLVADMDSMQAALVPALPSRVGELAVSAAYQPADGPAAGGDFYDAFALGDGRVAIILGDVSGHGRAALAHAVRMRYTLRAYVEAGLEPRAALKLAGEVLGAAEGDLFTTVSIATYDKYAACLTYATAGHPAPLTLSGSACEAVSTCASPALGWAVPTGRRQTTIPFGRGAVACFFSDGLTEAHTADGLLGAGRLGQILANLGSSGTAATLLSRVRRDAQAIRDDMAACIIRATSGGALVEASIEEFEVDSGQLASRQGQRFLEACGVPSPQVAPLITQAHSIAGEHGAAVFRVTKDNGTVTATVSPSKPLGTSIAQHASRRAPDWRPAGEPVPSTSPPRLPALSVRA